VHFADGTGPRLNRRQRLDFPLTSASPGGLAPWIARPERRTPLPRSESGSGFAAVACALLALVANAASPGAAEPTTVEVGEAIYLRGVLASGAPLEGTQSRVGVHLRGADAACVNCHQRSGLGSHEGGSLIPPSRVSIYSARGCLTRTMWRLQLRIRTAAADRTPT